MLISVIIPVYNVEQYLKQCLDSVINQTLTDIEIICVNDGSTDNSLQILEEYQKKDSRVKIVNQDNKGVSTARNEAIKISSGEYLFFIDSDDWLEQNSLEILYQEGITKNVDIIAGMSKCYYNDNFKYFDFNSKRLELKNIHNSFDDENIISTLFLVIRGKMYKKEFILNKNIIFNPNLSMGEDGVFNYKCIYKGATFSIITKHVYNYRLTRKHSLTDNLNENNRISDYDAIKYMLDLEEFKNTSEEYKLLYVEAIIKTQMDFYEHFNQNKNIKRKSKKICKLFLKHLPKNILEKCRNFKEYETFALHPKCLFLRLFNYYCWHNFIKNHIIRNLYKFLK